MGSCYGAIQPKGGSSGTSRWVKATDRRTGSRCRRCSGGIVSLRSFGRLLSHNISNSGSRNRLDKTSGYLRTSVFLYRGCSDLLSLHAPARLLPVCRAAVRLFVDTLLLCLCFNRGGKSIHTLYCSTLVVWILALVKQHNFSKSQKL